MNALTPQSVLEVAQQGLLLVLVLSLPAVVVAGLVGLLLGVLQAVTSIQDQSIPQSVKLLAVLGTLLLTMRWMGAHVLAFAEGVLRNLAVFHS